MLIVFFEQNVEKFSVRKSKEKRVRIRKSIFLRDKETIRSIEFEI